MPQAMLELIDEGKDFMEMFLKGVKDPSQLDQTFILSNDDNETKMLNQKVIIVVQSESEKFS